VRCHGTTRGYRGVLRPIRGLVLFADRHGEIMRVKARRNFRRNLRGRMGGLGALPIGPWVICGLTRH
jgi:hypothetical protein